MLIHHFAAPQRPSRAVVLGAAGFVGGAITARLEAGGVTVLPLARRDLDLEQPEAGAALAALLRPDDALIFVTSRAPVRNVEMLAANIAILRNVTAALASAPVAYVLYISSDAVYADSAEKLTEQSCAGPGSLHGVMHLARELALREAVGTSLGILRPTLIYGAADPHNGYGPNRFRRLAQKGEDIVLFGEGEERRDHVLIDDVAELAARMVLQRSAGVLNCATGAVIAFRDIAEKVVALAGVAVAIKGSPRSGPMPHGGYRPFDPSATIAAFPDFRYTPIDEGLRRVQAQTAG